MGRLGHVRRLGARTLAAAGVLALAGISGAGAQSTARPVPAVVTTIRNPGTNARQAVVHVEVRATEGYDGVEAQVGLGSGIAQTIVPIRLSSTQDVVFDATLDGVLFATNDRPGLFGGLRTDLRIGGKTVGSQTSSSTAPRFDQVVCALPGAAPKKSALSFVSVMGGSQAILTRIGGDDLASLSRIDGCGTILAQPDDLALGDDRRSVLVAWLVNGGQLLVAGAPEAALPGLQPAGAVPLGDGRIPIGNGALRRVGVLPDDAVPAGLVEPDLLRGSPGAASTVELASDAGVKTAPAVVLGVALLAYCVVVGPALVFVLRRRSAADRVWIAVPAIAVLAAGLVYAAGGQVRGEPRSGHERFVQTSPLGGYESVDLGVVTTGGGTIRATAPATWSMAGFGTQVQAPGGTRTASEAILEPGGFGTVQAAGPAPAQGLVLSVEASGTSGRVRNETTTPMHDVAVFAARSTAQVGDLAPGAEAPWGVDDRRATKAVPTAYETSERAWPDDRISDRGFAEPYGASSFRYFFDRAGAPTSATARPGVAHRGLGLAGGAAFDAGDVVAVGFTSSTGVDLVAEGHGTSRGVTTYTARATVPGALHRDLVLVPPNVRVSDGPPASPTSYRFIVPAGASLRLRDAASVWGGTEFTTLAAGTLVDPTATRGVVLVQGAGEGVEPAVEVVR